MLPGLLKMRCDIHTECPLAVYQIQLGSGTVGALGRLGWIKQLRHELDELGLPPAGGLRHGLEQGELVAACSEPLLLKRTGGEAY